ncbi:hypothetical protein A1Q_0692 [Vibrio campbellii HY01]|nr:hypothetical protein A1Q_0692 [Vibrio campbellii HY01]
MYVYYSVRKTIANSGGIPTDTYANGITINQVYMR